MKTIRFLVISCCLSIFGLAQAAPININTADASEIIGNLTNIGAVKAAAIIDYRDKNGPFKSAHDLLQVKGIGEKTITQNAGDILFDTPSVTAITADNTIKPPTIAADTPTSTTPAAASISE